MRRLILTAAAAADDDDDDDEVCAPFAPPFRCVACYTAVLSPLPHIFWCLPTYVLPTCCLGLLPAAPAER